MIIAKTIKEIDSKGRIGLPKNVLDCAGMKPGDSVYFGVSKSGNVVICKLKDAKAKTEEDPNAHED
ncbi:MAG: AbrB/MazE/SpoVT family DNA-binding domain-containing protein [Bacilli bacterium]|jgi:bifunctional DNA-binding transcriptional regulator/antitoxin component of YhaV-PrlF toxin-antitoxin module|nr:AbrB/MazE/SpoVT family DNA-binding domain-containing protein [Bacilli bacterium]